MRESMVWFAAAVLFLVGAAIWFAEGNTTLGVLLAACAVMMGSLGLRARSAGHRPGGPGTRRSRSG